MKSNKFIPSLCPVCERFYFSLPEADDPDDYVLQCSHCGWIYDADQLTSPDSYSEINNSTLTDFIVDYKAKIQNNPDYDYFEEHYKPTSHLCPVCGKYQFKDIGSFAICPECGWQDDSLMEAEPEKWEGTSNDLCLNDFKTRYQNAKASDKSYSFKKKGLPE